MRDANPFCFIYSHMARSDIPEHTSPACAPCSLVRVLVIYVLCIAPVSNGLGLFMHSVLISAMCIKLWDLAIFCFLAVVRIQFMPKSLEVN
jgi:hypothetical protein